MKVNTGGHLVARTSRDDVALRARQLANGKLIFQPGATDAHSEFFTLDPTKVWLVSLVDAVVDSTASVTVLRHSMTHRSPCAAENIHDQQDMFDFIRTNGYQVMSLGGEEWKVSADSPLLVMAVPGTYSFLLNSNEHLETVTVTYEEYAASDVLPHLPAAYYGGIK